MSKVRKTISNLVVEYFRKHPKEELKHGPVVDWVEKQYLKLYGKKPRDTWRVIRKLHEEGILIKVKKVFINTFLSWFREENCPNFLQM
jgi:isoleucyl-tRNA synthetase